MGNSLLDDLGEYLCKEYISELKEMDMYDKSSAIRFLRKRKAEDYSIRAWNDAHSYITGHRDDALFPEEARIKLVECLKK